MDEPFWDQRLGSPMQVEEDVLLGLTVGHPIGELTAAMFTHERASVFRLIAEYCQEEGENPGAALLVTLAQADNRIPNLMRPAIRDCATSIGNRAHEQPDRDQFDRGAQAMVNRESGRTVLLHLHDIRSAIVAGTPLDITMIEDCFETLRTIAAAEVTGG